jgi:uncharacterized membrane protein (DUF373 family)
MTNNQSKTASRARHLVTFGLTAIEDVVYVGLGVVLAATALCLLFLAIRSFVLALVAHALSGQVISLLDQILLILLIIELLYTVQVSFREHALMAEPFLVVALIATVRKILIATAQISQLAEPNDTVFHHSLAELSLLSLMVLILVGSLVLLQRHGKTAAIDRSER